MYNYPMTAEILPQSFYARDTLLVARDLLGMRLVRMLDGQRLSGVIVEAEAYIGEEDQACHAKAGRTPRTAVMYGDPGRAYVYFTYGMHWMLNVVTQQAGFPAAALLRAIAVDEGQEVVSRRRPGVKARDWTNGPGKLCQALGITGALNGIDLTHREDGLWIEAGQSVPDTQVLSGPRVGIGNVPEPWLSKPWRFRLSEKMV